MDQIIIRVERSTTKTLQQSVDETLKKMNLMNYRLINMLFVPAKHEVVCEEILFYNESMEMIFEKL